MSLLALLYSAPVGTDNAAIALRLNDNDTSSTSGVHVTMMVEQDATAWEPQGNSSANATGVEHNTVSMFTISDPAADRAASRPTLPVLAQRLDMEPHLLAGVGGALTNVWISVAAPSTATWTANPSPPSPGSRSGRLRICRGDVNAALPDTSQETPWPSRAYSFGLRRRWGSCRSCRSV